MKNKLVELLRDKVSGGIDNYIWADESDIENLSNEIIALLSLKDVMCRLPDSDEIRQQAQQMDEKEFDQWWWETVYKAN